MPSPVPRLIARSMLSFGMLWARAERMALRSRALPFGSPPPVFAAMVISRDSLLKSAPRFVSMAPLKRLTLDHLLCPDMRWESYEVAGQTCFLSGVGEPRRGLLSRRQINEGIKPRSAVIVNEMVGTPRRGVRWDNRGGRRGAPS